MNSEAERRVMAAIRRIDRQEEVTPEDLERFRQTLPTEPATGRLVNRALPFPWSEVFEFVEGSDRQSAYWRTRPDRNSPRSEADRRHRERFAEAARESKGLEETVKFGGREIPRSAAAIADKISEASEQGCSESGSGERALNRLREVLG